MSEHISIRVDDGSTMNAYVARPGSGGTSPGIIVFQEAFGVNAHIRDVTDRFAALGFTAVAPEMFHRTAAPGFEAPYGDMAQVMPHIKSLTRDGMLLDAKAVHDWLAHDGATDPDRIAAIGFCMGGSLSFMTNGTLPIKAAVSFYGGSASDHLDLAKSQSGPILMFWGGADTHIPPEKYRAVADALTEGGANHEQVVFSQADHGFFCDKRDSYNPAAATQAWALTQAFLKVNGASD